MWLGRGEIGRTYGLTRYIGVPDLGGKFHDWRFEGVFIWNGNRHFICSSFVWCALWTFKRASKIGDAVVDRLGKYLGLGVGANIRQILCYPPSFVSCHFARVRSGSDCDGRGAAW